MQLSKEVGNISSSITLAITAKVNELKSQGIDVVNFGDGEPDFNTSENVNSIEQYSAIEALDESVDDLNNMIKEFENRRNFMIYKLEKLSEISIIKPSGEFYIMINISAYLNTTFKEQNINNSVDFARVLLEEEKVAVIPGDGFGLDDYIRLSYATSMDVIENGIDRISTFLSKIK